MSFTDLKRNITYGPVYSRRLGYSMGINLLENQKICSFDCLYCEKGWTKIHTDKISGDIILPSVTEIITEVENVLRNLLNPPNHITFAGNGEPTLHPDFDKIVDEIIELRDKYFPFSRIAILSNSSTVSNENILYALSKLDKKIMKLDAGNQEMFELYNSPANGLTIDEVTEGLCRVENVIIQSLFTEGKSGNFTDENIHDWLVRLKRIKPVSVQLYTLDRAYPSDEIAVLDYDKLEYLRKLLFNENIEAEVF
jgi:wyosine [tRNA(Phe)-imidazoG37] synthetase (radical SAM superfamily)